MRAQLSPCQSKVLAHIKDFLEANGYPPTRAEIQKHFGWRSANAAQDVVKALARKGAIHLSQNISRGIKLTHGSYG